MYLGWLQYALIGVAFAYFFGGIPWAVVLGKVFHGADVRQQGSGNSGTTNALRSFGWGTAFLVFLLDMLKGLIPVVLVGWAIPNTVPETYVRLIQVLTGSAAIVGHVFSPYINFKGGKGVATASGVILGLNPVIFLFEVVIFISVALLTRYVSVASITIAVAYPVMVLISDRFDTPVLIFSFLVAFVVIIMHRGNLARLRAGTENRLDLKRVGEAKKD